MFFLSSNKKNATNSSIIYQLHCSQCNVSGHSLEHCFKVNPNLPIYSHCHILGHTKDKCYCLNGYPPGHKNGPDQCFVANIISLEQGQTYSGSPITQDQFNKFLALLQSSFTLGDPPVTANQAQLLPFDSNSSFLVTLSVVSTHKHHHKHFIYTVDS